MWHRVSIKSALTQNSSSGSHARLSLSCIFGQNSNLTNCQQLASTQIQIHTFWRKHSNFIGVSVCVRDSERVKNVNGKARMEKSTDEISIVRVEEWDIPRIYMFSLQLNSYILPIYIFMCRCQTYKNKLQFCASVWFHFGLIFIIYWKARREPKWQRMKKKNLFK